MSYNIDSCEYLGNGKLLISVEDLNEFCEEGNPYPEDCFLWDLEGTKASITGGNLVEIIRFAWNGTGSGRSYDFLIEKILPKTKGEASIIFTWEGGESVTGLHVKDGVVTKKKVKFTLED